MSSNESVFSKIRALNGLIRAYTVYLVSLSYTFIISMAILALVLVGSNLSQSVLTYLGLSEIAIFVTAQIFFLFFLINGWKYIRSMSRFKFYFYFSVASFLILILSLIYFGISFSDFSPEIPLSFTFIQLSPLFFINCIFLSGIYLLTKDNSIGFLSLSSIFAIIFTILTLTIGILFNSFSFFFYVVFPLIAALLISIIMTIASLRRALRNVENIIIEEITSI